MIFKCFVYPMHGHYWLNWTELTEDLCGYSLRSSLPKSVTGNNKWKIKKSAFHTTVNKSRGRRVFTLRCVEGPSDAMWLVGKGSLVSALRVKKQMVWKRPCAFFGCCLRQIVCAWTLIKASWNTFRLNG